MLTNISTRGHVGLGDNVLIAGFILSARQTVKVQARGPSLAAHGIVNPIVNPTLDLFSGQTLIASGTGAEPELTITLEAGPYTAIVAGGEGIAIVEVFAVDDVPVPTPVESPLDVDVRSVPVPAPTGPAGASMGEQPGNQPHPGSGPGPCGSYQVDLGSCSAGMAGDQAIERAWLYILEDGLVGRFGNSIRVGIPRRDAMLFRFRTAPASGLLTISLEENTVRGVMAPRFVTISEVRGDFNRTKIGTDARYQQMSAGGAFSCVVGLPASYPYVALKPDTNYYLAIRCEGPEGQISTTEPYVGQTISFN